MTPFASVFQRMLWLVLVSFLSDYKTLPAFHPSEHKWMKTRKKFIRDRVYVLSLCLRLALQQCGKGLHLISCRRLGTLYVCMQCVPECVLHVILPLLYVPVTCPWGCTARDFASALRSCHLSLSVYCTWFCPCYTFLLPVPVCVPHEILLLTRIALTCPCNTSPRFSLSPRNPYDITYCFFGPF